MGHRACQQYVPDSFLRGFRFLPVRNQVHGPTFSHSNHRNGGDRRRVPKVEHVPEQLPEHRLHDSGAMSASPRFFGTSPGPALCRNTLKTGPFLILLQHPCRAAHFSELTLSRAGIPAALGEFDRARWPDVGSRDGTRKQNTSYKKRYEDQAHAHPVHPPRVPRPCGVPGPGTRQIPSM